MKNIKYIFGVVGIVLFAMRCQPDPLDITLPEYEPSVVVASQVLPGEIMFIGLTRSFTILSSAGNDGGGDSSTFANILVDSAFVSIEHGGQVDTLFNIAPGLFASTTPLDNPGTNYNLKVIDYMLNKTATASAEMLAYVQFDTVYPILDKGLNDTLVTIHAEFTDDPSDRNFYMLNIYSREILSNGLDLNSFFSNGENKIQSTVLYTDTELSSLNFTLDIEVEKVGSRDSIAVALSNISEGYYDFLKKREKGGNIFTELTNEPINYPSNITGGIGFFNTHFPDVEYFDLNEF